MSSYGTGSTKTIQDLEQVLTALHGAGEKSLTSILAEHGFSNYVLLDVLIKNNFLTKTVEGKQTRIRRTKAPILEFLSKDRLIQLLAEFKAGQRKYSESLLEKNKKSKKSTQSQTHLHPPIEEKERHEHLIVNFKEKFFKMETEIEEIKNEVIKQNQMLQKLLDNLGIK